MAGAPVSGTRGGDVSTPRSEQVVLIKAAIETFLARLDRDPADGFDGLKKLALALDNLVVVYFQIEAVEPGEDVEPPKKSYPEAYKRATQAYPELGFYPYADPGGDPGKEEALVADAIDDLADIAGDLTEVLWHFENSGEENGNWGFRFGYQHHWGDHLRSLRNYLHSSRIAAW